MVGIIRFVQGNYSSLLVRYRSLRAEGHAPREAWQQIKQAFLAESTATNPEQAWKNASGRALEQVVAEEFAKQLEELKIKNLSVQAWSDIKEQLVKRILSETLWLRGELQEPYIAESRVDFVAFEQSEGRPIRVIAVYSCKASLRERFQQDLYWAEKFRSRGIRFCFITLDNDGVLLQAATQGTLSSKQAKMALALYDKVYLLTEEPIRYHQRILRPIDSLGEDLHRWQQAD